MLKSNDHSVNSSQKQEKQGKGENGTSIPESKIEETLVRGEAKADKVQLRSMHKYTTRTGGLLVRNKRLPNKATPKKPVRKRAPYMPNVHAVSWATECVTL